MGFYIRKSISVGPFRFNLSKSGVGVSAGIKGFRVGSGPRGNYIHMGRGGLYYRATVPRMENGVQARPKNLPFNPNKPQPLEVAPIADMREIESAVTTTIVDSSSAELVEEMNAKRKRLKAWPITLALGLGLWIFLANSAAPDWMSVVVFFVTIPFTLAALIYDTLKKTTVLFYELDEDAESRFQKLHESFVKLASCNGIWHVSAEGSIKDRKRNAGASSVIRRSNIKINKGNPPYVKSNVSAPYIPVGKQTQYFFPDKVLVFETNGVGAVSYKNLIVSTSATRFVEEGNVPRDAEIVDRTWKYVNKKGGPDKRFKDNRELPIARYEDVAFKSNSGLNELIQVSRVGFGANVGEAIKVLATVVE